MFLLEQLTLEGQWEFAISENPISVPKCHGRRKNVF